MLKIFTRKEVAAILRLSVRTVDYLVASGQIPHRRIGRSVRFSESALQRWMDNDGGVSCGISKEQQGKKMNFQGH